MAFDLHAVTPEEFSAWAAATSATASGPVLDEAAYRKLLMQTQNLKPYTYRSVAARSIRRHRVAEAAAGRGAADGADHSAVSAQQEN